jgi:hypothetical protein
MRGRWQELTGRPSALAGGERAAALLAVRVLGAGASNELVAAASSGERGRELVTGRDTDGNCEQQTVRMTCDTLDFGARLTEGDSEDGGELHDVDVKELRES